MSAHLKVARGAENVRRVVENRTTAAPDWANIPGTEEEAMALGCTCKWWARGAIVAFDPECPIADRHHRPESAR